jgi:adenylate cyclase
MGNLSRIDLASEAGTTPGRVDALVRAGVLRPGPDGSFTSPDISRIRLADAYERAGIGLDLVQLALDRRWVTFERIDDLYRDSGPRSSRTVAEFRESLGSRGPLLTPVLAALGLPNPADDDVLNERDEQRLSAFLRIWDLGDDPDVAVRAGRIIGEAMRRVVDGWLELFAEHVTRPLEDRTRTVDEMSPIVLPRAATIISETPDLLMWLFQRHLDAGMDAQNVASMEAGLAREGLLPERPARPPAIAFVDLAGYTRLTETQGDELAARSAARLAELADVAARPRGGRLVKLLGDGAMLHFHEPRGAVLATLDLIAAIREAGLPPGHAGISAGPVVARDGDYFGHTVNLAARLSAAADPGIVLATRDVVEAVEQDDPDARFEPVGELEFKNVGQPVAAFRVERAG